MRSWGGGHTPSERFTAKGSDGVGCGKGTGEEEMDFAIAISWRSRKSGATGKGREGVAGVIILETDGADAKGAAIPVPSEEAAPRERNVSDAVV